MIPIALTLNYLGVPLPQTGNGQNQVYGTTPGQTLVGKTGVNNIFFSAGGGTTMIGGGASDWFYVRAGNDQAVVAAGSGIATVQTWGTGDYTLPANVENGIMQSPNGAIFGNSLPNILQALNSGTLVAGSNNDVLIGAGTAGQPTRYVISGNGGNDVISNFTPSEDLIQLDAVPSLTSFASVQAAMTQVGNDVQIALGTGKTLTIRNETTSQLTASNFYLPVSLNGYTKIFGDSFSGFNWSANGSTGWMTQGATGWRSLGANHEAEFYSDPSVGVNPFSVANSVLTITATPGTNPMGLPYNSGMINSHGLHDQEYGYFVMKAQLPAGAGMWPAFWLLPTNYSWPPEIDVFEQLGSDPNTIFVGTHSAVGGPNVSTTTAIHVANTTTSFHTYAVDWEPNTITWYFDGTKIFSEATPADMHQPMYMIANLAIGGQGSWPGPPTSASEFPAKMQIDYIRAYASPNTINVSGSAGSGSGGGGSGGQISISGWGQTVTEGNGTYVVTGTGSGANITLGNGNQTISDTGGNNHLTTGNGNQSITFSGDNNTIVTGTGASSITVNGSYTSINVGPSLSGTTTIAANGWGDQITATGNGTTIISGTTGNSSVTLGDGNSQVTMGGSGNSVTVGVGTSIINAGIGQSTVHTGGGNDTITVSGWGNLLDAGPGTNILNGGNGNDTFMLNGVNQGSDLLTGFKVAAHDVLDISRTLAGASGTVDLTNVGNYITASQSGGNTILSVDPTGGHGTPYAFATLQGVVTDIPTLLSYGDLKLT